MEWTYGAVDVLSRFAGHLEIDADSAPFWDGLSAGEIRVQRCRQCGTHRFPPGPFCLGCGSSDLASVSLTSTPRLFSWIVVNRSTHRSMPAPYVVAVIEFDEGVRLPAALQVTADVDELTIGMPVSVTVEGGERPFIVVRTTEPDAARMTTSAAREESTWPAA